MRNLLSHLLEQLEGVRVSGLAKNSAEARFEILRRRPDLVLLDEVLPGESSHDFLVECHQQQIPVLLVTGLPTEQNPAHLKGALARLQKPSWKNLEKDRVRFQSVFLSLFQEEAKKGDSKI